MSGVKSLLASLLLLKKEDGADVSKGTWVKNWFLFRRSDYYYYDGPEKKSWSWKSWASDEKAGSGSGADGYGGQGSD